MTAPETLLPTNFGNAKKKRAARIIDDDEELPDGRLPQTYDDLPVVEDLTGVRVEEDDGGFIRNRLNKAMKLKNKKVNIVFFSFNESLNTNSNHHLIIFSVFTCSFLFLKIFISLKMFVSP